jgi:outer membrane protein assembly factor BamB
MSELDKIFIMLAIALIVMISVIGVALHYTSNSEEVLSPSEPSFLPEHGPVPERFNFTLSSNELEIVQGESFSITLYMTSLVSDSDATTNFSWYLGDYQNQSWSSTEPVPLEIIFDPNQSILKYNETKTTIITINSAEDAPLGEYRVNLELNASTVGSSFHGNRNLWITIIPFGSSSIAVPENDTEAVPYSGPLWQRPLKNFATSLTVGDGKVFTIDDPGNVFCFDSQNGESLWNSSGKGRARNPTPVLSEGLFYFGFEERELGCLDINNGTLIWTFENLPAPEEPLKGVSAHPIIEGDRLFAMTGSVSAFNLTTRRLLWQAVPGQTNFGISLPDGPMKITLLHGDIFDGKYVYATGGNYSNLHYYKIDTVSKKIVWCSEATWGAYFVPFFNPSSIPYPDVLAVSQEKVIIRVRITDEDFVNLFLCLDSNTGKELWSFDVGASIYNTTVQDNLLLFGSGDGYFYALHLEDGTLGWKTKVDSQNLFSSGVHSSSPIQIDTENQRLFWSYATEENETNYTGALMSLSLADGKMIWMTETNSSCGGLVYNNYTGMLFLTTQRFAADVGLWIFYASTGDLIDSQQQYDHYILPPIVYGKETFVAADLWLTVY